MYLLTKEPDKNQNHQNHTETEHIQEVDTCPPITGDVEIVEEHMTVTDAQHMVKNAMLATKRGILHRTAEAGVKTEIQVQTRE